MNFSDQVKKVIQEAKSLILLEDDEKLARNINDNTGFVYGSYTTPANVPGGRSKEVYEDWLNDPENEGEKKLVITQKEMFNAKILIINLYSQLLITKNPQKFYKLANQIFGPLRTIQEKYPEYDKIPLEIEDPTSQPELTCSDIAKNILDRLDSIVSVKIHDHRKKNRFAKNNGEEQVEESVQSFGGVNEPQWFVLRSKLSNIETPPAEGGTEKNRYYAYMTSRQAFPSKVYYCLDLLTRKVKGKKGEIEYWIMKKNDNSYLKQITRKPNGFLFRPLEREYASGNLPVRFDENGKVVYNDKGMSVPVKYKGADGIFNTSLEDFLKVVGHYEIEKVLKNRSAYPNIKIDDYEVAKKKGWVKGEIEADLLKRTRELGSKEKERREKAESALDALFGNSTPEAKPKPKSKTKKNA
jgi:hypothetical protein